MNIGRDTDKDNWGSNGFVVFWAVEGATSGAETWGLNTGDPRVAVGITAAVTCVSIL